MIHIFFSHEKYGIHKNTKIQRTMSIPFWCSLSFQNLFLKTVFKIGIKKTLIMLSENCSFFLKFIVFSVLCVFKTKKNWKSNVFSLFSLFSFFFSKENSFQKQKPNMIYSLYISFLMNQYLFLKLPKSYLPVVFGL